MSWHRCNIHATCNSMMHRSCVNRLIVECLMMIECHCQRCWLRWFFPIVLRFSNLTPLWTARWHDVGRGVWVCWRWLCLFGSRTARCACELSTSMFVSMSMSLSVSVSVLSVSVSGSVRFSELGSGSVMPMSTQRRGARRTLPNQRHARHGTSVCLDMACGY